MRHAFHLLLSYREQARLHTDYVAELDFYMSSNCHSMRLNAKFLACCLMFSKKSISTKAVS